MKRYLRYPDVNFEKLIVNYIQRKSTAVVVDDDELSIYSNYANGKRKDCHMHFNRIIEKH